ncbi:MAG: NAD-dependent epimerase/dehydratase family protein [Candidatus Dormibacteria bacterium]
MSPHPVLVTGGAGFLGGHCVAELLGLGHRVRATVRSEAAQDDVRRLVEEAGVDAGGRLDFAVVDLLADAGWAEAMEGVEHVLHVASPFPAGDPADPNELIIPAREGTLRVLRAAEHAGARRVVVTSSFAAIGYGHADTGRVFTEEDWTNLDAPLSPYVRSKTLAERAAWSFAEEGDARVEVSVVNPVGIFGPVLGERLSTSVLVVEKLLQGTIPRLPDVSLGVVDVRDVVDLHLRAMEDARAAGQRFIATAGVRSLRDIAAILRTHLGAAASKVPSKPMPDLLVRASALLNPEARAALPHLGQVRRASSAKARRVLDWAPRSPEEAVLATAESLLLRRRRR